MSEPASGAVIVISSHVIRGSVGNRAAVFALETLGYPVWAFDANNGERRRFQQPDR